MPDEDATSWLGGWEGYRVETIQRGHRYATVVIEPHTRRVLWVGRERSRDGVRPFFDLLGEDGCRRIKAVAMDMNAAYANEVRDRCPHA